MAGFQTLPREEPRASFLPSPLLSGSYSPESYNSPATPVTPPSSVTSTTVDILEPSFRAAHVYTPNSMGGDYMRGYDYNDSHSSRRDSSHYHQGSQSPTRRSPGHSPKSYSSRESSSSRYHYTPYGLEKRSTSPPRYHNNEANVLPWPSSATRRPSDPLAPLNTSPIVLPPFPTGYQQYLRPGSGGSFPPPPPLMTTPRLPVSGYYTESRPSYDEVLASSDGFKCQRCRHTAGSREQLSKHQQKHQKIHHCRFQGCNRQEGFATPNDRERHEKSVHKIPGHYWKCLDENCSSYGKEFSRRDNLKDHLRRMHPLPDGLSETEASLMRSKQADAWRFEKQASPTDATR